jgi:iron(III) transport system substrate-binding protein
LRLGRGAVASAAVLACGACNAPATPVPPGYPAAYAKTIEQATAGRDLVIWSAIDRDKSRDLLNDFRRLYPGIRVHYVELPGSTLYERFVAGARSGARTADFLWSSAMDLQIKLVNDGYTQPYVSPERSALPPWGNWKDQAWGTTAEPIVFVYNRTLIADAAVPRDHSALTKALESPGSSLAGKVATYDLPRSAVGYLYLSQDQQATHDAWRLIRAMKLDSAHVFASAEGVLRDVAAGNSAIGYNIVGSYALAEITRNRDLGLVMPRDYTLVMSRIAVIPAAARHPDAARLFLDFLLSRRGQARLAEQDMPPVRGDVPGPPQLHPAGAPLRAIRVGPALLVDRDQLTRAYVLRRWRAALAR